jgi:ParB/RepB/Spo0J family partition protein
MTVKPAKPALHIPGEGQRQMPNVFSRASVAKLGEARAMAQTSRPIVGEQYREVFLTAIARESPIQARAQFDPEGDDEDRALVESLARHGQRVPVQLAEIEGASPPEYAILDGHRRIAALRHLKRETVKAVIVRQGSLECDLISLTANVRKNLSPLELARAIDRLRRLHKMTIEAIAQDAGLSRQYISSLAAMLEADPAIPAAVEAGHISATTARVLSQAPRELQPQLTQTAVACGLSDAQAKRLVGRVETTGEASDQAALVLGFAPVNDKSTGGPEDENHKRGGEGSLAPRHNPVGRGRSNLALTVEGAAAMLKDFFPRLEAETVVTLSALAVQGSASLIALKVAGLLAASGRLPAEALEAGRFVEGFSGVRKLASVLDVCGELRALIKAGRFQQQLAPLLSALANEFENLERQVTA